MKKISLLFSFCIFFTTISNAQQRIEYASFLKTDTAVKWAAVYDSYINLSTKDQNAGIRRFYLNKLNKQGITYYLDDSAALAVTAIHTGYDQYLSSIKKVDYDATKMNWYFDNSSDSLTTIFNEESNACDSCLIGNKLSIYKIRQLLYYKNNRLWIQNILLAPVIYKKTNKADRQTTEYFEAGNLALNEIRTGDTQIPASAIFITRASNDLVLSTSVQNNMINKNNEPLSLLLYRDIKKRLIKAYDTRTSILPDPKHGLDYRKIERYQNENVLVPEFDTLIVKGYKTIFPNIYFDDIYNYTLIQDLYFDFEKEKLYSKLVAFVARKKIITSTGKLLGLTDYWGFIFPPEKKKVTKPGKK